MHIEGSRVRVMLFSERRADGSGISNRSPDHHLVSVLCTIISRLVMYYFVTFDIARKVKSHCIQLLYLARTHRVHVMHEQSYIPMARLSQIILRRFNACSCFCVSES